MGKLDMEVELDDSSMMRVFSGTGGTADKNVQFMGGGGCPSSDFTITIDIVMRF